MNKKIILANCPKCGADCVGYEVCPNCKEDIIKQKEELKKEYQTVISIIVKMEEELKDANNNEKLLKNFPPKNAEEAIKFKKAGVAVRERKEDCELAIKLINKRKQEIELKLGL